MKIIKVLFYLVYIFFIISCSNQKIQIGKITKITKNPDQGFNYDYYLYIPNNYQTKKILVIPNNSGFCDDNIRKHEKKVRKDIKNNKQIFADKLGCPILMPVFPRSKAESNMYVHALDKDTLESQNYKIKRIDIQLINMIKNSQQIMKTNDFEINDKILLFGFSASGMFANRFTLIHPEIVESVVIGSPGGWPIAPIASYENNNLSYPVGIYGLSNIVNSKINIDLFNKIPQFFIIGDSDKNDSVPYDDGYENDQKELVFKLFGDSPVSRWKISEDIYKSVCKNVTFKIYTNTDHNYSNEMKKDVIEFFQKNN